MGQNQKIQVPAAYFEKNVQLTQVSVFTKRIVKGQIDETTSRYEEFA